MNEHEREKEIQGSWIPHTPQKPIPQMSEPIYPPTHANQTEKPNHSASHRAFSLHNVAGLDHLTSGDLLALANKASFASAQWNYHDSYFTSRPCASRPLTDGWNSQDFQHGTMEESQYKFPASSQHHYQLNFPLQHAGIAVLGCGINPEFAPITPEKPTRKSNLFSDKQSSKVDYKTDKEQVPQNNEFPNSNCSSREVQCCKESQELVGGSSLVGVILDSEENRTPQKTRRKKHRPKVVAEAKAKSTTKPETPKPLGSKENTRVKRKYVRKKGVNKGLAQVSAEGAVDTLGLETLQSVERSSSVSAEAAVETLVRKTLQTVEKSCRRSLTFEDKQLQDIPVSRSPLDLNLDLHPENCCDKVQSDWTVKQLEGTEVDINVPCGAASLGKQVTEKDIHPSEQHTSSVVRNQHKSSQRRKQNSHPVMNRNKKLRAHKAGDQENNSDFLLQIGCKSITFAEKRQEYEPYRPGSTDQKSINTLYGFHHHDTQECQRMAWLCFPNIQPKTKSNKEDHTLPSCTLSGAVGRKDLIGEKPKPQCRNGDSLASMDSYYMTAKFNVNRMPTALQELRKGHSRELVPPWGIRNVSQTEYPRKKRSKNNMHGRDINSLNRIIDFNARSNCCSGQQAAYCFKQDARNSHVTKLSVEDTISAIQLKMTTKKQRTKRKSPASLHPKEVQLNQTIVSLHHPQFSPSLTGTPPEELWKQFFSVDAISEQMRQLDINRSRATNTKESSIVPFPIEKQEQHALVPYRGDGTIMPYQPIKKKPRPRVDLDDETIRVWKLLVENINSEGINGTDEEMSKWWEEERRVFRGRADSFIARMHLVQGDRRFTPWKGSVVDSVVGVFLTQNVSDHLSSSAFMSLAARFPVKASCQNMSSCEEGGSSVTHEAQVYLVESEELLSVPSIDKHNLVLTNQNEENEAVDSTETLKASGSLVNLADEAICLPINSAGIISEPCQNCSVEGSITGVEQKTFMGISGTIDDETPCDSVVSSTDPVIFSPQDAEKIESYSESKTKRLSVCKEAKMNCLQTPTTFMELLKMASSNMLQGHGSNISSVAAAAKETSQILTLEYAIQQHMNPFSSLKDLEEESVISESSSLPGTTTQRVLEIQACKVQGEEARSFSENEELNTSHQENVDINAQTKIGIPGDTRSIVQKDSQVEDKQLEQKFMEDISSTFQEVTECTTSLVNQRCALPGTLESTPMQQGYPSTKDTDSINTESPSLKAKKAVKEKKDNFDWDSLRRCIEDDGRKRERTAETIDSIDWEAVRSADVNEVAQTIRDRGMNNKLAERIKDFLDRLVKEHGSIDLEWLRDLPPDKAKEYLLSIKGLGLKSVECVRLLTLHQLAFPVDTNVGRIAVRLGWVPLQPLPETLQLHLLELYPVLESIQKYLWPRLCKLDQRTLYELHYQMITFGKVFCTKSRPNCNACPMRGECRHFASAFASARLPLPGPEDRSLVESDVHRTPIDSLNPAMIGTQLPLFLSQAPEEEQGGQNIVEKKLLGAQSLGNSCEPIIEEPASPEPECAQVQDNDIEDACFEDPDEIPTIKLNVESFTKNLQKYMQEHMELQEAEMSKALVALTAEAASIPMPKLKNISQLRTEHQVYELPDSHPLLEGLEKREPDDPCSYLLAIWTPGETPTSIQPPDRKCISCEDDKLCSDETCFSCNSVREARSQIVRGTLLIPCRTAMRGSFPLNGTYFQVNEVFADHESSLCPMAVPRNWLWNLPRKTVYFGTSIPTIFRGLSTEGIQHCFWRGYVCVRGFDQKTRAPRPLIARLHFPASRLSKTKGKTDPMNTKMKNFL